MNADNKNIDTTQSDKSTIEIEEKRIVTLIHSGAIFVNNLVQYMNSHWMQISLNAVISGILVLCLSIFDLYSLITILGVLLIVIGGYSGYLFMKRPPSDIIEAAEISRKIVYRLPKQSVSRFGSIQDSE